MPKADLEKAKRMYPSTQMGTEEWTGFFGTSEGYHALGRILGDIYDFVKAEEEREAGMHRMGRRPRRTGSLDDVYRTVFPQAYTMDPFREAMLKLLAGRSQRAFAPRIPMTQSSLNRLLRGEVEPDMQVLEAIANAAKVHPSFFVEWRAMYVSAQITRVLTSQPNVGVKVYKEMSRGSFGQG